MNYELTGIQNERITLSVDSLDIHSVDNLYKYTNLNYRRINSSWFYSR